LRFVAAPSQHGGATLAAPPSPACSTFKNADTLAFQDDVGQAVLQCCRAIPDGVLLFMPSYAMLDKMGSRWKVGRGARPV
jgi:Rad3-related DNA helicase